MTWSQPSALQLFGCPGCGWLKMLPTRKPQMKHQIVPPPPLPLKHSHLRHSGRMQQKSIWAFQQLCVHFYNTKYIKKKRFVQGKGHRLQSKQIRQMQMLRASRTIRHHGNLTTADCQWQKRGQTVWQQSPLLASAGRRVQRVQIELFLHNFLYYLEQIRAASSVLDNDFIFNNGHIQEGRP